MHNIFERSRIPLWNAVAVLGGLLPIALYWLIFACEPSVSVAEARAQQAQTNPATLALGIVSLLIMFGMKHYLPKLPSALTVVVLTTLAVGLLG